MSRRRRLTTSDRYTCQTRTVAGGALLSSMASLGGVGVGMWLLVYSRDFVELIGLPLRDAFAGYCVFAAYMTVTGIIGACVSLVQSTLGLLTFAAFLGSNLVCQASIFAYIVLESKQVMAVMNTTILRSVDCRTFTAISYKFYCKLDVLEYINSQCILNVDSELTELASCSNRVNNWLQKGMWAVIAVSAVLIAFQLLLIVTSLMLRHMIAETQSRHTKHGCCPWQRYHNRTAPARVVSVTPIPSGAPQWPHDSMYTSARGFHGIHPYHAPS